MSAEVQRQESPAPLGALLSVAEARARMLALVQPLGGELIPLQAALGRVLADSVIAVRDQPPFDVSAMDGYALRSSDTPGRVQVCGESAAGHGHDGRVHTGMAIRSSN